MEIYNNEYYEKVKKYFNYCEDNNFNTFWLYKDMISDEDSQEKIILKFNPDMIYYLHANIQHLEREFFKQRFLGVKIMVVKDILMVLYVPQSTYASLTIIPTFLLNTCTEFIPFNIISGETNEPFKVWVGLSQTSNSLCWKLHENI